MSAIGAIFNFHRRPFAEQDLHDLTALWHGLHKWGLDGGRIVTTDVAGFCYRAFNTNREARLEKQPLVEPDGRILAADVRIDNRAELFAATHNILTNRSTDVDYLMVAHTRWGAEFPFHVAGEYAFALYDPYKRRLLLCRDHIGARPLYYYHHKDRLIVSSQLAPLLDLPSVARDINEEYVAGYMARGPRVGLTPYKHIHSVLPAHVLTVTESGCLSEKRYWQLEPGREIRFTCDAEYEEAFRHHVRNAVLAPLRTDRPVMIELSGGLDSSTVACVAAESIKRGETETTRFDTVSLVYDESPTSDERQFIDCVETHLGRIGIHVRDEDCRLLPASGRGSGHRQSEPGALFAWLSHGAAPVNAGDWRARTADRRGWRPGAGRELRSVSATWRSTDAKKARCLESRASPVESDAGSTLPLFALA